LTEDLADFLYIPTGYTHCTDPLPTITIEGLFTNPAGTIAYTGSEISLEVELASGFKAIEINRAAASSLSLSGLFE
jgi:hypothetical protein